MKTIKMTLKTFKHLVSKYLKSSYLKFFNSLSLRIPLEKLLQSSSPAKKERRSPDNLANRKADQDESAIDCLNLSSTPAGRMYSVKVATWLEVGKSFASISQCQSFCEEYSLTVSLHLYLQFLNSQS